MNSLSGFGSAETVVLKLIEKLLKCGHALYVDNFYISVPLAEVPQNQKTLICGTLKKKQKTPTKKIVSKKLRKGQHIAKQNGRIVVEKWQYKREVLMLLTHHSEKMIESNK